MKRRDFLATAGTVAAAGLLPEFSASAFAAAPPPDGALKLGLASYSVRNFKTLDQCLEMAKKLEVKYINFKDFHLPRTLSAEELRAARAKTEAAGLTIMGGGTITLQTNDEAAIRKDFEYARNAGMPLIVAAPSHATLDLVEKVAKEYKIKVAIHNHGPEDKHFPSPYDAYKAIKGRDPVMGLCIDVGHTVRTGTDPTKAVLELKDRVYDFHVKDLRDLKDKDSQCIIGKGAIDFVSLLRALLKIKFTGHVGLEYEIDANDPLPGMQQSLAYLRGVLAAVSSPT